MSHELVDKAADLVKAYAREIATSRERPWEHVHVWDGDRMARFADNFYGYRDSARYATDDRFAGAIVWEDSDFDAVKWAFKVQQALDPEGEQIVFEPFNDFIIEAWRES
jgi:hypothetical protein